MTNPSKSAMRAARELDRNFFLDHNQLSLTIVDVSAEIIDRETDLPELVKALRACDKIIRYAFPDSPCVETARKALEKHNAE